MFKRVGKEIRTWAKVLVILEMIPIVLAGIACALYFIMDGYGDEFVVIGILCGILIIVVGYFLARLSAIMLYSWGELVERTVCIDERLEKLENRMAVPAAPAAPVMYNPPAYNAPAYNPYAAPAAPVAPKPVAPAQPVHAAVPVKNTTLNTPAMNVPIASVPVNNDAAPEVEKAPPVKADWTCTNCGQVNSADGGWCCNCGTKKNL